MPTRATKTLIAVTLAALAGCGGPPAKKVVVLKGTATYKGQQMKSGLLKFVAPNGDVSTTSIQPDGTFVVTDVVPGTQKVALVSEPQNTGGPGADAKAGPKPVNVPSKFADAETSGVTVTAPEDGGAVAIEFK